MSQHLGVELIYQQSAEFEGQQPQKTVAGQDLVVNQISFDRLNKDLRELIH